MKIAASGFVSEQGGSVASANALLLRGLLDLGHEIDFFSKSRFVDPRPSVGDRAGFRFVETDNVLADRTRAALQKIPLLNFISRQIDCITYNQLLTKNIRTHHEREKYDVVLWLGEYAPMRIAGAAMVSFAQGPPGTDARSVINHFETIKKLAGWRLATKWLMLAKARLSAIGLPKFANTDFFIVGSGQSKKVLESIYNLSADRIATLPYPIDLSLFNSRPRNNSSDSLRVLWLGRIIPRKRIDLFLEGVQKCIESGYKIKATVVGDIGFIKGYDKYLTKFKYPDQLRWIRQAAREDVPALMAEHDVLVQPSEEENFGSSVAEAQAVGLPVIVGKSNGNADYLCSRDIVLEEYTADCLANALVAVGSNRAGDTTQPTSVSRTFAVNSFSLTAITLQLEQILNLASALAKDSHRSKVLPSAAN